MDLQKVLALITPYSLLVSLLYLFGYWGSFGINILEYIALSDVLKSAMSPLLYSSLLLFIGFSIGNLLSVPIIKYMPPGGGKDLPEAKYFRWMFRGVMALIAVVIAYKIFFESGNYRWFSIAALSMVIIPSIVGNASYFENAIPIKQIRVLIINVFLSVSFYAFGWGAIDAELAKNNDNTLKINEVVSEYSYIGWAGDFLFLWNKSEATVITKAKSTIQSIERNVKNERPIIDLFSAGD
jgi:hypothetical protein